MANAFYRRLTDGTWLNQANPGGPAMFRIEFLDDQLWHPRFSWDGVTFTTLPGQGNASQAVVQQNLDNYVGQLNAGTA